VIDLLIHHRKFQPLYPDQVFEILKKTVLAFAMELMDTTSKEFKMLMFMIAGLSLLGASLNPYCDWHMSFTYSASQFALLATLLCKFHPQSATWQMMQ